MLRVKILVAFVQIQQQVHPVRRLVPRYSKKEIIDRQHLRSHNRGPDLLHGLAEVLSEEYLAAPVRKYEAQAGNPAPLHIVIRHLLKEWYHLGYSLFHS